MFSVYRLFITVLEFYAVALGSRTNTALLCTGFFSVFFLSSFSFLALFFYSFFFVLHLCSFTELSMCVRMCECMYVNLHVFLSSEFFPIYLYRFYFIVLTTHLFRSSTFYGCVFCLLFSRTVLHHHEFAYHSFFCVFYH